jgi:hypothetical protein
MPLKTLAQPFEGIGKILKLTGAVNPFDPAGVLAFSLANRHENRPGSFMVRLRLSPYGVQPSSRDAPTAFVR